VWPKLCSPRTPGTAGRKRGSGRIMANTVSDSGEVPLRLPSKGPHKLMIKATNTAGSTQPDHANWNGAGFHAQCDRVGVRADGLGTLGEHS